MLLFNFKLFYDVLSKLKQNKNIRKLKNTCQRGQQCLTTLYLNVTTHILRFATFLMNYLFPNNNRDNLFTNFVLSYTLLNLTYDLIRNEL